jgi:dihydrofolate reductase
MMRFPKIPVVIVAAMSKQNHVIGKDNQLLWHIPDDLKRFKELTTGHPIIMGRKTYESIVALLGHTLPNRHTIVVTSTPEKEFPGADAVGSLEAAFALAERDNPTEIHIGGGALIYDAAMPFVDRMYLTYVDDEPTGDAHFPHFGDNFTITKTHDPREHNGISYQWIDYERTVS